MSIRQQTTICRICEAQCGLNIEIDEAEQKITAITPDTDHIISQGYACIKGLTFEDFRASPDRLTTPLKRVSNKTEKARFEPISWEQALQEIGGKVRGLRKNHGDDATGMYFGNPISFSLMQTMFITGFVNGLNTRKSFNTSTLDCNNKFVVAEGMYGAGFALTYPDIERNQFLMIIGSNPVISKMSFIHFPHPAKRLNKIIERGGRVIHVNPRRTESVSKGAEHVSIHPDTDVFFLLSFLREILSDNQNIDQERINTYMNGFDKLWAIVEPWPAERTAPITHVATELLREQVSAYLAADGAAIYSSTGVNQGSNGVLAFWLQEIINAVTGNLDRLGGVQMGEGILDYAGLIAKNKPETHYSRIGNTPSFMSSFPCGIMSDEILTPGEGQIKAMFVVSGNPLLSSSNSTRFEQALKELELLVSIDIVCNETAEYADYILPGTHFSERPDIPFLFSALSGTNPIPWFQYVDALVEPPGDAKDELWILHQLGTHCDAPLFGSKLFHGLITFSGGIRKLPGLNKRLMPMQELLLDLVCRFTKQGSLKKLRRFPHGKLRPSLQESNYLGKRVVTESKKVELAPEKFVALAGSRLEETFLHHQQTVDTFKLITKRERFSHNGWAHNHKKYIAKDRNTNYLYVNPEDLKKMDISDGDKVCVETEAGSIVVPVKADENMMPQVVALPHGWGHANSQGQKIARTTTGVNANILASDGITSIEPLSGMTQFNGIPVAIHKL